MKLSYSVPEINNDQRIDLFLTEQEEIHSRSYAQKLIAQGLVTVNGVMADKSQHLRTYDSVEVDILEPEPMNLEPEKTDLKIIYEDNDLAVVSKPAGMVVHPSAGHASGTLVHAMLGHAQDLSGIGGIERPGIIHRLDKDTSGLIIIAKNDAAHLSLAQQIADRSCRRRYVALVSGNIKEDSGFVDAPIARNRRERKKMAVAADGRAARTDFKVLERYGAYTLLELSLTTGRTHQIRVHMAYIRHPVVGDEQYGGKKAGLRLGLNRQFLHATSLAFKHPATEAEMELSDPLPADLQQALAAIRSI